MKNFTFFKIDENLLPVIKQNIFDEKLVNYKQILTGWTNIVYLVETDKDCYIFRFPRNDLFSKRIVIDCEASKFLISNLTEYTFAKLQLKYDENNRPFSKHNFVKGTDLLTKFSSLTDKDRDKIAKIIAQFYSDLHRLKLNENISPLLKGSFFDFANDLANIDDNFYDFSKHNIIKYLENSEEKTYVYGDLNSRNILLNDRNEIVAFLDYSFFSISSPYIDLSRIAPSVDEEFLQQILFYYKKKTKRKIDEYKFEKCVEMIKYIEEQYRIYMNNNSIIYD